MNYGKSPILANMLTELIEHVDWSWANRQVVDWTRRACRLVLGQSSNMLSRLVDHILWAHRGC